MKKKRLIIAGGGTGGHIYPGLAVAEQIQKDHKDVEILFVGTKRGLEKRVVPKAGLKLLTLPVAGINRVGAVGSLKALVLLPMALFKSLFLLLRYRPSFVLGMGGYASGPFVLMASLLGFRTAIWEINATPGVTNKILSRFVKTSWVVFDEAKKDLKSPHVEKVGMPVRLSIKPSIADKGAVKKKILIFGGSQGARGINSVASKLFLSPPAELSDVEVRFQTGKLDYDLVKERLHDKKNINVLSYLDEIEKDYDWADVVVCRSGASTVSELAAAKKAAILIPFPYAADDHQKINAMSLVNKGAARMIVQDDLTPEKLAFEIIGILSDKNIKAGLEESIGQFHIAGAASRMSDIIWESMK